MFARGSTHFLTTSRRSGGVRRQRIAFRTSDLQQPRQQLIVWTAFPALPAQLRPIPVKVRTDR